MCGKGSTTTATKAPPQYVQDAQQNLVSKAQSVASTPYQPYTGELTAGQNATQTGAIGQLQNLSNVVNPYLTQAQSLYSTATSPGNVPTLNASYINQFMSPYLNDVVNATQANINETNAEQQQSLQGNAIASGAWGGDRAGVAAAELARQQNLAGQQTIAGLYNQGYGQALSTAQGQQTIAQNQEQLGLQGASGLANLGSLAGQTALGQAGALFNAGTQQQQTAQNADTANYQSWLNQQQYPFQTTQYLSNILNGTASQAGGTETDTKSGNLGADLFGGALSILGTPLTGPFGLGSTIAGSLFGAGKKDGGRIETHPLYGRARGGEVPGYADGGMPFGGALPYSVQPNVIPQQLSLADLGSIVPPNIASIVPNSVAPQIKAAPSLANASNDDVSPIAATGTNGVRSLADIQNDKSWGSQASRSPLLNIGLGMLSTSNDPVAHALGSGGLYALKNIDDQRSQDIGLAKEAHAEDIANKEVALHGKSTDLEAKKLMQEADQFGQNLSYLQAHAAAEEKLKGQELTQTGAYQSGELSNQRAQTGLGYAQLNKPMALGFGQSLVDPKTGKIIAGGESPFGGGNITIDPKSQSLNAQTGLSQPAINYLTTGALPRGQVGQAAVQKEVQDWSIKNGINTATFKAQAGAANGVLQQNITRNNQSGILENELAGTIKTIAPLADQIGQGKVNILNLANVWAGKQVNDPGVQAYRDQLLRLRSELAGYNAVAAGKLTDHGTPRPDDGDLREAEQVINSGINSGGLQGLLTSVGMTTAKNKAILQNSIDDANQQMWGLFGVGNNYKRSAPSMNGGNGGPPTPSPASGDSGHTVTTKAPVVVKSKEERDSLPSGTSYMGPDGKIYMRK